MDLEHVTVVGFLAVLAVLLVVAAIVGVRYARQTRVELRGWVAENEGWTYTAKVPTLTARWTEYPVRAAGSASNVVRGIVPEGRVTCFQHQVTIAGSSTTTARFIGVLEVDSALPTVVAVPRGSRLPKPHPPEAVQLDDPRFAWSLFASDPEEAAVASRLFSSTVRDLLAHEAAAAPGAAVTLEGRQILVATTGYMEVDDLGPRIALLRDLARAMGAAAVRQPE